jgi:hypothetical protein
MVAGSTRERKQQVAVLDDEEGIDIDTVVVFGDDLDPVRSCEL